MKVRRVRLQNFRGVRDGTVHLHEHALLVGLNSVGKSTVCEALDLVLGPERMFRRPVIDEYDLYGAQYVDVDGALPEVRIDVVLTDLPAEAERRFRGHLRRWSDDLNGFADTAADSVEAADLGEWCLPLVFLGRFDPGEEDFTAGTFFAHPEPVSDDLTAETPELGAGLRRFDRQDKRLCGFLYLRPNRTSSRALSFQRGSLLDTIVRLEAEKTGPLWEAALRDVGDVVIANDTSGFAETRIAVRDRVARFLSLIDKPEAIDMHVSELTREHLRDVLRLFVATQPGVHGVPVNRLSTGSQNQLVFALLTYIAELKGGRSVIFAMEEPEIALPPHAQRRLVDFVVKNMGQVIVTSHSPYVIEKFAPEQIVALARDDSGTLNGDSVDLPDGFKLQKYRDQIRQFAEAVLARAVLVVEGATEAAVLAAVADALDEDKTIDYVHPDLAGLSMFNAQNDVSVPTYAPVFASMGKLVFGIHDTPNVEFALDVRDKANSFSHYEVIGYAGIEELLITEIPVPVQRRFAAAAQNRPDYPTGCGTLPPTASEGEVRAHVRKLLQARKGSNRGYGPVLIAECSTSSELPQSLANFLQHIDTQLRAKTTTVDDSHDHDAEPDEA